MKFEIALMQLPNHAPDWAKHLQHDLHTLIRMQAIALIRMEPLLGEMNLMTHTMDDVLTELNAQKTQVAGLQVFIGGLRQQISDALSGVPLPSDVQAKIDTAFDLAHSNSTDIANAMNTGTAAQGTDPNAPGDGSSIGGPGTQPVEASTGQPATGGSGEAGPQ